MRPAVGTPSSPTITVQGASGVVASSVVAAAAGYLILLLVAHRLTPAENANFLAFWSALFAVIGILGGVQSETTRAVGTVELDSADPATSTPSPPLPVAGAPRGASVLRGGLLIGIGLAVVLAVTSAVWAPRLFPHHTVALVAFLVVAAFAYAGHAAVAGAAAGRRDWTTYARLMGFEASWRLGAVVVVGALGAGGVLGTGGVLLPAACISSAVVWLLLALGSGRARRALRARADVGASLLARQSGHALLSAASTSALIVGFPIMLRLTSTEAAYALSAPLILAISLTRAPILIPLQAFQGVFIASFLKNRDRGVRALLLPTLVTCSVGLVGAALAFWVGPLAMTIFGSDYRVASLTLGALTMDAALLAVLTLSGTAVLAAGNHRGYSAGWVTATCVSLGVLLLPLPMESRAIISLTVGPLSGIAVHWMAIGSPRRLHVRTTE